MSPSVSPGPLSDDRGVCQESWVRGRGIWDLSDHLIGVRRLSAGQFTTTEEDK